MNSCPTLSDTLRARAAETPERRAYAFLEDGEVESASLTYAELDRAARRLAAALQERSAAGDRVLLLLPPGLDFVAAFFGCLHAGRVPVPAYPPRSARTLPRLRAIVADCRPAILLTAGRALPRLRAWCAAEPWIAGIPWIDVETLPAGLEDSFQAVAVRSDGLAFLQYTSGSTATPKGVEVGHDNLLHNQRLMQEASGGGEDSVFVTWLPVYHDMGLIGNILQAAYVGAPCIMMAPTSFLQRPLRWLAAVDRYRATTSGGPNFAYDLCCRKVTAAEREALDLTSWRVAFNGAEPVRAETLERFAATFGGSGFDRRSFFPCYGLAEATLMVCGGGRAQRFAAAGLAAGRAVPLEDGDGAPARCLVSSGPPLGGQRLLIVEPGSRQEVGPGGIGEIWIDGPSVAAGYWERPEETAAVFAARLANGEGPFLRTGDLGFCEDGEIFVTGRLKDLIILRGRNLYPQDVEAAAERSHPNLHPGGGAAFSVEVDGEERLVLVHEVERKARSGRGGETESIVAAVRRAIAEDLEARVHEVVLVGPGGVPRTTSGKVQRRACRDLYLAGELDVVSRDVLPGTSGPQGRLQETPTEGWLRQTVAGLAGIEPAAIDREQALTRFGLDSLLAVELAAAAAARFGIAPSLAELLAGASLAEVALALDGEPQREVRRPWRTPAADDGEHPLSWEQRSLWFLDRLRPGDASYNLAGAARLSPGVDTAALRRAVFALVDRHAALRMTYAAAPEGPVQRVHARQEPGWSVEDSSGWSAEELAQRLAEAADRPFDLAAGPLFRVTLFTDRLETVLVLAVHHIAADFQSFAILARDLGHFYARFTAGGPEIAEIGLPAPALRYVDYVRWQEEHLAEEGERLLAFWRQRLAGAPALDLPTDRPRPARTAAGAVVRTQVAPTTLQAVRALAARHGCTLFVTLLASLEVLLARRSGQRDFLLGAPTSGRNCEELSGLVGYLVQPVVLRADLAGAPRASAWLARVRASTLDAFAHREMPLALLAEAIPGAREAGRNPFFEVLLVLHQAPSPGLQPLAGFALGRGGDRLDLAGLHLESLPFSPRTAPLELTWTAAELDGGLALELRFSTDLFDRATMERLAGHFTTLLQALAADGETPVLELAVLSTAERRQLLYEWNHTAAEFPRDRGLCALFEDQAVRTPDAVALVADETRCTYRELASRVGSLAGHLQRMGVGPEVLVGVAAARSPDLVTALLAVLKAGGAYVPLDPGYPPERLAFLLADSAAPVLITETAWRPLFAGFGGRTVRLDDPASWRETPAAIGTGAAHPQQLAYLIYTSGSTGVPKGVAIRQGSAVARVAWALGAFPPEWLAGALAATSICFDLSVFEIFVPLAAGGTVILVDNALELAGLPGACEVTLVNTVPSAVEELVRLDALPPSLRVVNLAGEALRRDLVARLHARRRGVQVLNLYGPSEDTTYSSWERMAVDDPAEPAIGRPLANTRIHLLDAGGDLAPVGVPGELWIAGEGVARGYWRRPGLTAERFRPDPFAGRPGERLYRTGDLARRRPDGRIDFLGRLDGQVKVRGFRVEPGEIETALAAHGEVEGAVVVALEEPGGGHRLAAFVVVSDERALAALRPWLRDRLPEYMQPTVWVRIFAIPRTPNGKVDRTALRHLAAGATEAAAGSGGEPRGVVEELVAGIWSTVLGRGTIGRGDDFFALGGHSLLATRVISQLRGVLGVDLPLQAFFASSTVAGIAAVVEELRRAADQAGVPAAPPIEPAPRDGEPPLSFGQRRLWLLHQLEPDSPVYNLPLAVRLAGDLDPAVLAGALSALVARHEPLRTTFRAVAGEPVQVVAGPAPVPLPLVDLAALPEGSQEAEGLRLAAGEAERPFDLARGPVLRALLLRRAPGEHRLLLTLHHIAGDGWSLDLFLRELAALYRLDGLPPLPVRYADYAVWQRSQLRGPVLGGQLSWWRRRLEGAPAALELPMEHPYPAEPSSRGAAAERLLAPELCRRLDELGRREGTTPFMTLLAALAAVLHRYTGQDDLVVGTPIAGRTRAETDGLIGFFLNTLALRIDLSGDPTARELLGRVREGALAAFDHQDVPFESVLEELRLERDLSRTPLFQVVLNWLGFGAASERIELPGLVLERLPEAGPSAKFDLEIYAGPRADGIFLQAVYRRGLFAPAQIDDLLAHLEEHLAGVTARPELRLSELPPAPVWDEGHPRGAVAGAGFPREAATSPRATLGRSIAERFATQAAVHAGRPAVVAREGTWTYAELAREAGRVAHALLALRGFRDDRVALLFSPGPAMVAAVLGALAAGKTYVPLDPSYPRERLLHMLADSGAGAILTGDDRRALARELAAELPVAGFGELPAVPDGWAPPPVPPEALAYLLYTSGSTGRPKGVMQSQRNVLGHIRTYSLRLGLGPADRVLLLASYSFDAAVMDLFGALLNGAALCIWDLKNDGPEGLGRWIAGQGITVYHSTPTVYRAFLDGVLPGESFPSLRLAVLGGEETRRQDLERFREVFPPGCRLVNGLGPTESTLALQRFFEPGEPIARASLPVGWPVDETRVRLDNGAGEQPAVWGTGEIGICSPYLAAGYWNRPDLTAERFVPDPGGAPGARLYRTGDLARRLPDGALEFLGRADGQVKIRGFRIETGEIEAALAGHPGVHEAAVVAREDSPGELRLVAYAAGDATAEELRRALRERLPDYMVPAAFVLLESLPRTPNGKLDRRALPAPAHGADESRAVPRGPVEEILAGIWVDLLGVANVGAHDDFFALGGHSLLATRVVSRVQRAFGVELALRAVFEEPTVAGLASRIEEALRGGAAGRPAIERSPEDRPGVLSFAQERLWFLDRLQPGSAAYNMPAALRLTGPLDLPVLAAALAEIVRRHEVLRTTFTEISGVPVPVVAPPRPLPLPLVDLAGMPRGAVDREVARLVREEVGLPFDLERGPLLRLRVLRLGDGEHLVLFTVHHIAADGWSLAVFANEVAALYSAVSRGAASPLPELPIQYADFAAWQRQWLAGEVLESDLAWWRQRLDGAPEVLELPADRPRTAASGSRGGSRSFVLPSALAAELTAVARRQGSTLFMVLLAAFQAWLHRLTGEEDLCVGAPVAGRTRVETEGLIGLFANTLVLRGQPAGPAGALSARELLAAARETVLAAHAHQDLPFERLVEELRPERSLGRSPLFQVLLVLQNTPGGPVRIPGLDLQVLALPAGGAKLDLSLTWREVPEGLSGQIDYAADLFDDATVARWQEQLATLLAGLNGWLDAPVSALPLLGPGERHQLLFEWNDTGAESDRGSLCLHTLVARQAERTPDAVAVTSESGDLTYGELLERGGRQAARLRAQGIGPGSFVPLVLGSSPELVIGMLAALQAGAAFVPLDPEWPEARRQEILDELSTGRAGAPGTRVEAAAGPEAPIYAIYTSGSTGRPKGVIVPHRGIVNRFLWMDRRFGAAAGHVLQTTRPIYDSAVWQIFWPLTRGGRTVLTPSRWGLDPDALTGAIERHGITMADFVPSVFNLVVDRVASGAEPRERLSALRAVVVGGEEMDLGAARAFRRLYPRVLAVNLYGPTEASIGCTCHPIGEERRDRVPIGRPIDNVAALILDAAGSPVPVGAPGELYLAGRCVGIGYLEDPEKTARAFLPNPLGGEGRERMYRTGDRARWLPDGSLEFLGRLDRQVKIRGLRIELGEIEAVLAGLEGVREAVVVVREGRSDAEPGDRRLVAYLVGEAAADGLRGALRERLPEHMIPATFVTLAALPLTPGGKVDRQALPAPEWRDTGSYRAPRTPVEEILAGIWAELLGLERVGADDHFFHLGGHSLLATQVVSRIREAFGVEIPLRDLFETSRLEDLAAHIEAVRIKEDPRSGQGRLAPPLVSAPREEHLPLSFAQQRLWFLDQLEPGSAVYNMPASLRVRGSLNPRVLARCLGEIARRHEALRTSFALQGGSPVQRVRPAEPFRLPVVDLRGLPEDRREALALALAGELAVRPFDLTRGPLLRGALLWTGRFDHVLTLALHHIAGDGWSIGLLVREVTELYAAFEEGRPSPLAELPVQYADYAVWQRAWLRGEVLDRQLAWWKQLFATLPAPVELPSERPRPPVQTSRGAAADRLLSPELSRRIEELGRHEGTTPFMTLLAALAALIHRYTGQDDLVVGSPIAGRTRVETEGLIGFFLNTLALRVDLAGDPTVRELLRRVRGTVLGASDHQDVPFELLLEEIRPERDLSRTPLFQVMLNWMGFRALQERFELPGLVLERMPDAEPAAKFDLEIYAGPSDGRILLRAVYNRDLFAPAQIEDLLTHFEELLAGMTAAVDRRLSELPPAIGRGEGRPSPIEAEGSRFPREALDRSIPERFAAQVATYGERMAVVAPEGCWTYAELAREADRVAHALAQHGARGERVALLFSPGRPMVAAVMGTLAAGAAYVPLDSSHPRERLLDVLADSGAVALLAGDDLRDQVRDLAAEAANASNTAELPVLLFGELPPAPQGWAPQPTPPEAPAYLLYTSGSTGRPKGVLQSHRNVLGHIRLYNLRLGLGPEDRVLLLAQYGFDAAVMDLFGALLSGATLCLWDLRGDGLGGLGLWMAGQAVTVYHSTPTVYRAFLDSVRPGESFPALRLAVLGGEEARRQDLERFREVFPPGCLLVNGLGPTESTLALQRFLHRDERVARAGLPIGWPVDEIRVRLRNGAGEQPAVWGIGELEIGSPYLALGYWGQPHLTAERFVPDPDGAPGARLYRMGDLARRLPDGELEFLGRADGQVKMRGYRIELGEIESALVALDGVRQAVVLLRDDAPGARRLVAYVVGDTTAEALHRSLQQRLPEPMVPSAFVTLEALPLTPNGKLDRKALPVPEGQRSKLGYRAPHTPVEEVLAGIWAELLGLEQVGVDESFFDLGGHSLLATQVMSRVRNVFGVDLPLRSLFASPTVAGLAAELKTAPVAPGSAPIERVERGVDLPLSFAQQRLWFLDQLEPGSPLYNLPAALLLRGHLSVPTLRASLSEVIRRHESLRTVFVAVEGQPLQRIQAPGVVSMSVVDLGSLGWQRREGELSRLGLEHAERPFDLSRGPLLRSLLVRLGETEHAVLLNQHHIVSDGWSLGVLVREMGELYSAFVAGRTPVLPALPVQYADFAVWQRSFLTGGVLARQIAWWQERLAGAPEVLALPGDRPRPPVASLRGASLPIALTAERTATLHAFAASRGATLFMVLLAAFSALLARLAGSERVVVGSPVANRNRLEIEGLIGFFANTLALPADLAGAPSLEDLVAQVQETTLGAYAHQDLPFERLVEALAPARNLAHSPLFQALFVLQNAPVGELALPGLTLTPESPESRTEKFDLSLALSERRGDSGGGALAGRLSYATDLFDAGAAERLLGWFGTLLAGALAAPGESLAALPLLSAAERAQLAAWRGGTSEYPREATIPELFAAQVMAAPDAMALEAGDEAVSYGELLRCALKVAEHLREVGVRPEVPVGLLFERSPEMVVATLGVLAAGGAYMPLDPAAPPARLTGLLAGNGVPVVLGTAALLARLPDYGGTRVELGERRVGPPRRGAGLPVRGPGGDGLAYVMFTSGSTGTPKGVEAVHRGVIRLVRETDYARFGADEVFLQLAPASFDAATLEIWGALLNGGRLVVAPPGALSLAELGTLLVRHGVTTLWLTAGLFHEMVEGNLEALAGVRQLLAGGDALSPRHVRRVREHLPAVRLINGYGPTEGTTFSACCTVDAAEGATVPIGRAIANTTAVVFEAGGLPAPVGVEGELWIGGDGLARGYRGRPDLTAERFRPDPEGVGGRVYHTGDRVRRLADGRLEFLGRLDRQVKLRGFRIEPREIERALAAYPGVVEAVVEAREDHRPGERRLIAYLVAAPVPEARELRAFLAARLPEYMLPAAFVPLPAFPLTANGKLDRRALPAPPEPAAGTLETPGGGGPLTASEEIVAAIWCELLGLSRVGRRDDFFALGGHSLLATRLVSRLRSCFAVDLPLRCVFASPTLGELTAEVESLRREGGARAERGMVRRLPRPSRLPLSPAQERLWFLYRLDPQSTAFNISAALELRGALAVAALAAALATIVGRHEALRTCFDDVDGEPWQVIGDSSPAVWELPVVDLEVLPVPRAERELHRLAAEEARRSFDLAADPLLRARLLRLGEHRHVVLLSLHHIVGDGWSMAVLERELSDLYAAFRRGESAPLADLPVQYADYALWQRRWLAGGEQERQLAYWRRQLRGPLPILALPMRRQRPDTPSLRGATEGFFLRGPSTRALHELSRREGVTLFMTLLAAWQVLLCHFTGEEDIIVGTNVANRTCFEVEGLIGYFVNNLALRTDLSGNPTFRELLRRVRNVTLDAYDHQDVPFEKVIADLAPRRYGAYSPLFQVMLVLENFPTAERRLPDLELAPLALPGGKANFELILSIAESAGGLSGRLTYDADLFAASTIQGLVRDYTDLLERIVAAPDQTLAGLSADAELVESVLTGSFNESF